MRELYFVEETFLGKISNAWMKKFNLLATDRKHDGRITVAARTRTAGGRSELSKHNAFGVLSEIFSLGFPVCEAFLGRGLELAPQG